MREPTFQYECQLGHYLAGEKPLSKCLACILGKPCPGVLKRVGPGSRAAVLREVPS